MEKLMMIPDCENIRKSVELSEKYQLNFEYNDFYKPEIYTDKAVVNRLLRLYKATGRDMSKDTMHGAFLDMTIHSTDPYIEKYSKQCITDSMRIASELGIRGVVFHTGLIAGFDEMSYQENWLEKNTEFYARLIEKFPSINIYMENMFDYDWDLLLKLTERINNNNFSICLDYAHAVLGPNSGVDWIKACAPYIKHMHINDNDLINDEHKAVGTGKIDWNIWKKSMEKHLNGDKPSILIEVKNMGAMEESIQFLERLWRDSDVGK